MKIHKEFDSLEHAFAEGVRQVNQAESQRWNHHESVDFVLLRISGHRHNAIWAIEDLESIRLAAHAAGRAEAIKEFGALGWNRALHGSPATRDDRNPFEDLDNPQREEFTEGSGCRPPSGGSLSDGWTEYGPNADQQD